MRSRDAQVPSFLAPAWKEADRMKLTVMTWNLENFFPVGVGAGPATQDEYDAKLATLVQVIGDRLMLHTIPLASSYFW
jgi:hypothetical protein